MGQKADRVYKFLMGARHPKVTHALAGFGFSDANMQDGWARVEACAELARVEEGSAGPSPKLVAQLDAFENVWLTVAKATLKANYPEVHDALLGNLWQSTGRDAAMTVGTFLKRLREMEAGTGAFAADGAAARALLSERGLTEKVVAEAEVLIAMIKTTAKVDEALIELKAKREKATAHAWNWYLEWSAIARIAVKDRRLLRSMGFLNGSGAKEDSEDLDEVEVVTEDPGDTVAAE